MAGAGSYLVFIKRSLMIVRLVEEKAHKEPWPLSPGLPTFRLLLYEEKLILPCLSHHYFEYVLISSCFES